MKQTNQPIYPINGVKLGITQAKVRYSGRDDLTVVEIAEASAVALVSTQNQFCAAPVLLARSHIKENPSSRYLLINTGNANAGTGQDGLQRASATCQSLAQLTNTPINAILPFSTGVIGERLPSDNIISALPKALANLDKDNWQQAASAIMTTDTTPKIASQQVVILDGTAATYHITGISKGAGMIRPNMATMLGFVATDACISPKLLQTMLKELTNQSFNRITIDGDTSTNDCCVLIATGQAQNAALIDSADHPHYLPLYQALQDIFICLAQKIVQDGEGATKFITVQVTGGKTSEDCAKVAYSVAHSPLVKTAFFACDPNWGRIVSATGNAGVALDPSQISVKLDEVVICERGGLADSYSEEQGQTVMKRPQITISIDLGQGTASDTVYTCDLSYDYVKINADYRS